MPTALELVVVLAAYALGGLNAGYYLVRRRTGQDLRALGSGTAGARNVGRVLGTGGFVAVFLLDAAKGVAAVLGARALGAREPAVAAAMLAVVAGHVWPAQLGFRGGKGASTAVGATVAFTLWAAPALVLGAVAARPLARNSTVAGCLAFLLAPPILWLSGRVGAATALGLVPVVLLVLFAHRANLARSLPGRAKPPPGAQSPHER